MTTASGLLARGGGPGIVLVRYRTGHVGRETADRDRVHVRVEGTRFTAV